jgi:hypothetical protein
VSIIDFFILNILWFRKPQENGMQKNDDYPVFFYFLNFNIRNWFFQFHIGEV